MLGARRLSEAGWRKVQSEGANIEERKRSRTGGVGRRAEPHHRQSPGSVHGGAVAGRHVLLPCPEWS